MDPDALGKKHSLLPDLPYHIPDAAMEFGALRDVQSGEHACWNDSSIRSLTEDEAMEVARTARREIRSLKSAGKTQRRTIPLLWPVTATAVVLLALLTVNQLHRTPMPRDIERSGPAAAFRAVAPFGDVDPSRLTFEWSPVLGAESYKLHIYDRKLSPVYQADFIPGSHYDFPTSAASRLEKGRTYFWKVTAVLSDGGVLDSEFFKFKTSWK